MLVLSRKRGQSVVAPNLDLAVTVLAIKGNRVRLGISAPEKLAVYRKEIWQHARQQTTDAKRKENRHEKHPLHPK